MRLPVTKTTLPDHLLPLHKLKGVVQRRGNKERAHQMALATLILLKQGLTRTYSAGQDRSPINFFNRCLENITPAFILHRVIIAGKLYTLPVPISDNRSTFTGIKWLRLAALKRNNSPSSFPELLVDELHNSLNNQGTARDLLQEVIDTAIDQRPFEHYLRKRKTYICKSRNSKTGRLMTDAHHKQRRLSRRRQNHFDFQLTRLFRLRKKRHNVLRIIRRTKTRSRRHRAFLKKQRRRLKRRLANKIARMPL